MTETEPYRVEDSDRRYAASTGIHVRALDGERWINADIGELDQPSLRRWLRSRGGENEFAEDVVAILLGHAR